MNPRTPSVDTILSKAVEIANPAERQLFVEKCCTGDAALRRRVERLVADHFRAGSFLERPAAELLATDAFTLVSGSEDADSPVPIDSPGAVIGPYRLLELIGEGGMGLVYVAEQQHPVRRRVALKIIKPGMDSRQVVARFEAERQALAMMDHANIAKIYDGGATPEGRPYFVMELVKGTPITDYCDIRRLNARQRLELFLDVCHAVQHAHQKGVIHRDLKPSNVLVEIHDVRPVVKVIDFGIAKATGQQLTDKTIYTALAQMVGTPMYMSPEQAGLSSLDVDTRSDVYSLGVLLYELLTGTTPFDSETLKKAGYDEMRRIIREEEPSRPSTRLSTMHQAALSTIAEKRGLEPHRLSQHLRGELDWIVMKSLEKDRNRRYESASALAADLQRYLDDEPILACPPSTVYRLRKYARRHQGLLVSTFLVVTALLTGSGVSIWYAMAADESARLAEARSQDVDDKNRQLQAINQKLEEKNRLIAAAEATATSNFGLAKRAVADLVTRVGRDELAASPQLAELRTGLLTSARDFYSDLIAANPIDESLYVDRAKIWRLLNNDQAALEDFYAALKLAPNNGDIMIEIGSLLSNPNDYRLGDAKLGAEYLRRAQDLSPQNPETWYEFARRVGDYTGDPLKKAYELEKDPAKKEQRLGIWQYYAQHDADAALATLDRALSLATARDTKFSIQYERAWILRDLDRREEAIDVLTQLIREDAFNHHLFAQRGTVYEKQGAFEQAISDYERAVELSQQCWWLRKRLAAWYFTHDLRAEVLPQLEQAIELHPRDVSTLTSISPAQIAACGDQVLIDGYRKLADRAVELNNQSPEALAARAVVCSGLGDLIQSEADFDAAMQADALGHSVYYQAALCALVRGNPARYREICRRIIEKFGDSKEREAVHYTAWTCGLAPQAIDDYSPAVKLAERNVAAAATSDGSDLVVLGAVLLRSGDAQRALQTLNQALEQPATSQTSTAYAVYFEALALQQLGRSEDAAAKLKAANALAEKELSNADRPPSWNRKLSVELLRSEAEGAIKMSDRQSPPD